jgi:ribosome-associated protein
LILDIRELLFLTDYFVIAHGRNRLQIRAIADEIHEQFKQRKASRFSLEGYEEARWILMDYGGVVIHLFDEKTRDFYALEMLWGDAPQLSWAVRAGVDKRS